MTGAEMTGIRRVFWWYENEGKYDWWEYGLVRKKCLGKHYFTTTTDSQGRLVVVRTYHAAG